MDELEVEVANNAIAREVARMISPQ